MSQQDATLVSLLLRDVDSHFRQFIETYQHQLYRLMYRQVGNAQDAEDIVQETFLRAYYALCDYAAQGVQLQHLRPWLYKIAFNLYYNRLRIAQPQMFPLDIQKGNLLPEWEHPDPDPGPEEMAELRESFCEVANIIATLPERYRTVLNLYYCEQFSYQEIADLLHQPQGTVKSKVSRGLDRVRIALAEQRLARGEINERT
ncbi:MAG TPA: RNA polymerase sigma factor [Ktedonobacteraceae bacterium]